LKRQPKKTNNFKSAKTKFLDDLDEQIAEAELLTGRPEKLQNVLISEKFGIKSTKWTMNGQYLFFYDEKTIKFVPLSRSLNPANIRSCGFQVSETEKNSKIKFVDCGPHKIKIAIVID
jgi:hypothetical protein